MLQFGCGIVAPGAIERVLWFSEFTTGRGSAELAVWETVLASVRFLLDLMMISGYLLRSTVVVRLLPNLGREYSARVRGKSFENVA